MPNAIDIRASLPADRGALEDLYASAFLDEDLLPLLRDLLDEADGVVSLAAVRDGVLAGHVVFSPCHSGSARVCLLGPLAVAPSVQRQGIGAALVGEGLKRMRTQGVACALVLGDPAYYGRFGFAAERNVKPPYDLPKEWRAAWQSLRLDDGQAPSGTLEVPAPWRNPAYWAP